MKPKFKIGQRVHVHIPKPSGDGQWVWTGAITKVADAGLEGDPSWEYWVDGGPTKGSGEFPLLAWESQITPEELK